ncbi:hypothetical protein [Rhizorhabdus wittichii]
MTFKRGQPADGDIHQAYKTNDEYARRSLLMFQSWQERWEH